jgi:mRNA interferase MazF
MHRGEVWWADLPAPAGRHPVLIVTRDAAIAVRNAVTVVPITRTIWHLPVEVRLDPKDGMPTACVANGDNLLTVPKVLFQSRICTLSAVKMQAVEQAIKFALDLK